jgi:diguanylate cyclase (GGDEF)-like protein
VFARLSFGVRLALTLALTLAVTGGVVLAVSRPDIKRTYVRDARLHHADDVRILEFKYRAHDEGESPDSEVQEALYGFANRRGHMYAVLIDSSGRVVASNQYERVGLTYTGEDIATALGGAQVAGLRGEGDDEHFALFSPVNLGGRRYVLHTETRPSQLRAAQAAALRQSLVSIVVALLLAVPAFYLLGGRSLSRAHRSALDRARLDGLTGLPNHRAFQDEIARAVGLAERTGTAVALAILDVDDFKQANDRLGHRYGDEILTRLADGLAAGRVSDRPFRLGGDEFALILAGTDGDCGRTTLDRIRMELAVRLGGPTVSIGFAIHKGTDGDVDTFWGLADAALYEAKRRGGDRVAAAEDLPDAHAPVSRDQRRALADLLDGGVDVAFQPIIDLESDRPLGFEALARPAAHHGFDGPGAAFAIAETLGKARELDALCRRAALDRAGDVPADALLFVNVVPEALEAGVESLIDSVAAAGVDPGRLVLEITERSNVPAERLIEPLRELRAAGFRVALDDVGSGNAGLQVLRALPVDFVKVDASVLRSALHEPGARGVFAAILSFAEHSGAQVIAEGIETDEMLRFVRDEAGRPTRGSRVTAVQGYLLGRPEIAQHAGVRATAGG